MDFKDIVLSENEEKLLKKMNGGLECSLNTDGIGYLHELKLVKMYQTIPSETNDYKMSFVIATLGKSYIRFLDRERVKTAKEEKYNGEQMQLTKKTFHASVIAVIVGAISILVTILLALLTHK